MSPLHWAVARLGLQCFLAGLVTSALITGFASGFSVASDIIDAIVVVGTIINLTFMWRSGHAS